MIRREFPAEAQMFRVTLGHLSVLVRAGDERRAIAAARDKLCVEMPRLWDVIDGMQEQRFQVELL
jgi:hypothetical protein